MILFPLAAIWVVLIVVWAIRKGVFQPPPPPEGARRPRPPRTPRPHERGGASARHARSVRRERDRRAGTGAR